MGTGWAGRGMKHPLSLLARDEAAWTGTGPGLCPGGGSDAAPQAEAGDAARREEEDFRGESNKILQILTIGEARLV
ncbi:hypothetical protein OR16_00815 [Cupriavidus basilensis OR16]|uniref:Uncharacterized protein n=1 Tax=Cupriavidus basilensis OR16 TaxID=1127483 RepID=H1RY46_9BURK|nr:hypothetical protein OR16_00815 [Cupriavidus basilensis OR16]